jgi:hypothetical protein
VRRKEGKCGLYHCECEAENLGPCRCEAENLGKKKRKLEKSRSDSTHSSENLRLSG